MPSNAGYLSGRLVMNGPLRLFLMLLIHVFFILACSSSSFADSIKVGVLLDLSGPFSKQGEAAYKSIQFAVEEINLLGGIGGKRLEITVFDTGSDGNKMLQGASQLKEQGVSALLGPTAPKNCLPLRKFAENRGIPLILISGTTPILTFSGLKTKWTFSTTLNFSSELKALFSVFKRRGYHSLGVLVQAGGFYRELFLWIRGYAPEYGLSLSCAEGFNLNPEDLGRKFSLLNRCSPDAALIWANSLARPLVLNVMGRADLPLGICHSLFDKAFGQSSNSTSQLLFVAVPSALVPEGLKRRLTFNAKNFLNRWGSQLDIMPFESQLYAAQAWDALNVLATALRHTGGRGGEGLRRGLEIGIKNYYGVIGRFSFDKRDHSFLDPSSLSVLRYFSGRWSLVR